MLRMPAVAVRCHLAYPARMHPTPYHRHILPSFASANVVVHHAEQVLSCRYLSNCAAQRGPKEVFVSDYQSERTQPQRKSQSIFPSIFVAPS